jgi:O-acetyl-ADP-ribose deacetylase (regulator of RNase III)
VTNDRPSATKLYWTNRSVIAFAGTQDPIEAVTAVARALVFDAIEEGWEGPPFDPFDLASRRGIPVVARQDLHDARLVVDTGQPRIEFNPTRPPGRVRFSIAHELAHTFFPDFPEFVRHRAGPRAAPDEWQLELLCDVAAAELLMPVGSFADLESEPLQIEALMDYRKRFDVSTEALLLRVIKLTKSPGAVFAASRFDGNDLNSPFRVDYVVSSSAAWKPPLRRGVSISARSVLGDCTAVGFTAKRREPLHSGGDAIEVQCVGVAPFPGQRLTRVLGLLLPVGVRAPRRSIVEVVGDATVPHGDGDKLIVHLVNDQTSNWGGEFAKSLKGRLPRAQEAFREWVHEDPSNLALGKVHFVRLAEDLSVATMVAQRGYRPSVRPRIRYAALRECLQHVSDCARDKTLSVHMPRIGTGMAGGKWDVIAELIEDTLVTVGVAVTLYTPRGKPIPRRQESLLSLLE